MKRISMLLITAMMVAAVLFKVNLDYKHSDNFLRDRVVKLQNAMGSCSGVLVKAHSGKTFVLTAKHCAPLIQGEKDPVTGQVINGVIESSDEYGRIHALKVIEISMTDDLMLLSADGSIEGINLAEKAEMHEHVHTITHGMGLPAYRTDGELLGEQGFNVGNLPYHYYEMSTTHTVPGSSGGCMVNEDNELVGILTGGNDFLSLWTPLSDIRSFLAYY